MRKRLKAVGFQDRLDQTHFTELVSKQLRMKDNDLLKLLRVAGLAALKNKKGSLEYQRIA